jgi:hypothetical protein
MTRFHSVFSLVATLLCLFAATPAFGQDDGTMTFGEEDAQEVDDEEASDDGGGGQQQDDGGGQEEGTMTFGEEDAADTSDAKQKPVVGLVAVPGDATDESQRQSLQQQLADSLQQVPDIELQTGTALLESLKKRTVATCVTEPLCLGSIGDDAGVERIVLAKVDRKEDGLQLDIDYFNVEDRLFIEYESVDGLGNFDKVLDQVEPVIKTVFEIREREQEPNYADQNTGAAQTAIAVGCGVLSAGALVGGIVFGTNASDIQSNLNSYEKNEQGVYKDSEFTQTEAQRMLNDAQGQAELANISYGLSGAFAIASGVLFLIDPGGDVAEESGQASLFDRLEVSPTFGKSGTGTGISAEFDF